MSLKCNPIGESQAGSSKQAEAPFFSEARVGGLAALCAASWPCSAASSCCFPDDEKPADAWGLAGPGNELADNQMSPNCFHW